MNIFKITKFITIGDNGIFDISYQEQQAVLNRFGDAIDDYDRSYKQYLCQKKYVSPLKSLLLNLCAATILPFLFVCYIFRGFFRKKGLRCDAIGEFDNLEEIIPNELTKEYNINNKFWFEDMSLSIADVDFIWSIILKYPLSPYFVTKTIAKIAGYSDMINRHNPKAIIVHGEFSCTSSILSKYCSLHNVLHINVMHGEKLFYIRDSYFRYDRCYVWDSSYLKLFVNLKADPNQFRVAVPPSLSFDCTHFFKQECYADYKYYLDSYSATDIKSIIASMEFIKRLGQSVKYRPHPRYSDVALLEKYVDKSDIEYPNVVSIIESVSSLKCAVGAYSTVLKQAYYSGKKVVLDDMTYKSKYDKLAEFQYSLIQYDLPRLSQYQ